MSKEYIVGTGFTTVDGMERRVDVTPDWQVWADRDKRLDNLDALSAVMIAGFVANIDGILDTKTLYRSSFDEYRSLVNGGADRIEMLEQGFDTRLGSVFSPSFRKIYLPVKSLLNKNILPINALNPRHLLLLSRDMTDYDGIVSAVRSSKIAEYDGSNNVLLQERIIGSLLSRGFINTESIPQTVEQSTVKSKTTTRFVHENIAGVEARRRAQSDFTNYREYISEMTDHIKIIGEKPFDVDDLVKWAHENGFNPNRGEVERIVLLEASRNGLVKRTNVYVTNSQVREMWKLI
jgi:hypothetical protein